MAKSKSVIWVSARLDYLITKQLETEEFDDLCLGMLGYMAPEVVSSKPYSLEADIFSLGALLYLFLYGQLPFSDKNHQTFLNEAKKQSKRQRN